MKQDFYYRFFYFFIRILIALSLYLLTTTVFFVRKAKAQSDTTHYDLGRIKVAKDQLQGIVIKGAELQQFFTVTTQEAILARVGYAHDLLYVVDGLAINDINAYSIYDIEEIVIVDNAIAGINSAFRNGLVAIVKTNRGSAGLPRITAAAKTGISRKRINESRYTTTTSRPETTAAMYHQYFAGARFSGEKWTGGASLDYIRDVMPDLTNWSMPPDVYENRNVESRLRTRLFGSYQISNKQTLSAEIQWSPNRNLLEQDVEWQGANPLLNTTRNEGRFGDLQSVVQLKQNFSSRFFNELSMSFNWTDIDNDRYSRSLYDNETQGGSSVHNIGYRRHLLLRDRIAVHAIQTPHVVLTPSINFAYRHLAGLDDYQYNYFSSASIPSLQPSRYQSTIRHHVNLFNITPAMDLNVKDMLYLNAGAVFELSDLRAEEADKVYPFAALSFDILKAASPDTKSAWKVFSSIAKTPDLLDFVSTDWYDNMNMSYVGWGGGHGLYRMQPYGSGNNSRFQLGTRVDIGENKWHIQYTYGQMKFERGYYIPNDYCWTCIAYYGDYYLTSYVPPRVKESAYHRAAVGREFGGQAGQWRTNLVFTHLKDQAGYYEGEIILETKSSYWQWNNGLNVGRFFASADMLYRSNERHNEHLGTPSDKYIFALQHAYAGYKFPIAGKAGLDVYAYGRNLIENVHDSGRFYYGLGVRIDGW